ncbi:MAG: hypothetical protein V9F04_10715 [Dermatophilaceae bacterium]
MSVGRYSESLVRGVAEGPGHAQGGGHGVLAGLDRHTAADIRGHGVPRSGRRPTAKAGFAFDDLHDRSETSSGQPRELGCLVLGVRKRELTSPGGERVPVGDIERDAVDDKRVARRRGDGVDERAEVAERAHGHGQLVVCRVADDRRPLAVPAGLDGRARRRHVAICHAVRPGGG